MVYITNGNHFKVFWLTFLIILLTSNGKCQLYLFYILNLNYWLTNAIFILIIVAFFWWKLPLLTYIIIFLSSFKFTAVQDFLFQKQLISTLVIGTIAIHPLGFYMSTSIFVLLFLQKLSKIKNISIQISYKALLILLTITLVLGGFWGLQSITWGYFWVNDTIECLLLLKVLYVLFKLHHFTKKNIVVNNNLIPIFILNLVIMSRLNLLQTRHNFITSQPLVYYILCSYCFLCISILLFSNWLKKSYVKFLTKFSYLPVLFILSFWVNFLGTSKYLLTSFIIHFLMSLQPKTFFKQFYLHVTILSFFITWNLWFNFFYLHYRFSNNLNLYVILYDKSLQLHTLYKAAKSLVYLEKVIFNVLYFSYNTITLLHNLCFFVILNSSKLFYFFLLIFFFKTGWI